MNTQREENFSYVVGMSFTQKPMKACPAYKIFKKYFPNGRVIETTIDGFNVILCQFYDRQTGMFGGGEYIVLNKQ